MPEGQFLEEEKYRNWFYWVFYRRMKSCDTVCVFTSLTGSIHVHLFSGMFLFSIKVPVRSPTKAETMWSQKNSEIHAQLHPTPTVGNNVTRHKNLLTWTKYQYHMNFILQFQLEWHSKT
jgi:hypothetical protein